MGEHEAEIERMKNIFMSILGEIKSDIDTQQMPGSNVNVEMFQNILAAAKENPPVPMDDIISMTTHQMSQVVNMDDEAKEIFKKLFVNMVEQN